VFRNTSIRYEREENRRRRDKWKGEKKSLVHFLHQQADSLSWFKVHSPILFLWFYMVGRGGGAEGGGDRNLLLTSVFSHGFLNVSFSAASGRRRRIYSLAV
jgi:hypothetical protein